MKRTITVKPLLGDYSQGKLKVIFLTGGYLIQSNLNKLATI